ncbi:hypothetical protein [Roseomonas populi]|uniref:DUF3072 domain-containing protein n=1 Tax=Roseomonas populi TaxID=3121582 RepID=A0ABT1X0I0_9PROT|nr:hypothetical protein [Roseomonas pecuniae]MCR0981599.1 hypothetical protein [Roseomonas pecuniae]
MSDRPPEGPKADYGPDDARPAHIPRPPSKEELDQMSEEQSMITDEWSGEPEQKGGAEKP